MGAGETDPLLQAGEPGTGMDALDVFAEVMAGPGAPREADAASRLLGDHVRQICAALGLTEADIHAGGGWVTMLLTPGCAWEAVIEGPNAYQLYPGFFREDGETIVWPNVWVAEPYSLAGFVERLREALAGAVGGQPG